MNVGPAPDLEESSPLAPLAAAADQPKAIIEQASSIAVSLLVPDDALVEVSDQLAPVANRSRPLRPPRGLTPEHQVAADLRVVKTLHVGARQ
jgi:hypothetical protein